MRNRLGKPSVLAVSVVLAFFVIVFSVLFCSRLTTEEDWRLTGVASALRADDEVAAHALKYIAAFSDWGKVRAEEVQRIEGLIVSLLERSWRDHCVDSISPEAQLGSLGSGDLAIIKKALAAYSRLPEIDDENLGLISRLLDCSAFNSEALEALSAFPIGETVDILVECAERAKNQDLRLGCLEYLYREKQELEDLQFPLASVFDSDDAITRFAAKLAISLDDSRSTKEKNWFLLRRALISPVTPYSSGALSVVRELDLRHPVILRTIMSLLETSHAAEQFQREVLETVAAVGGISIIERQEVLNLLKEDPGLRQIFILNLEQEDFSNFGQQSSGKALFQLIESSLESTDFSDNRSVLQLFSRVGVPDGIPIELISRFVTPDGARFAPEIFVLALELLGSVKNDNAVEYSELLFRIIEDPCFYFAQDDLSAAVAKEFWKWRGQSQGNSKILASLLGTISGRESCPERQGGIVRRHAAASKAIRILEGNPEVLRTSLDDLEPLLTIDDVESLNGESNQNKGEGGGGEYLQAAVVDAFSRLVDSFSGAERDSSDGAEDIAAAKAALRQFVLDFLDQFLLASPGRV